MNDYSTMMHLLALFVVIWGGTCSVSNWIFRITNLHQLYKFKQVSYATALDILWLFGVVVLAKNGYITMLWEMI